MGVFVGVIIVSLISTTKVVTCIHVWCEYRNAIILLCTCTLLQVYADVCIGLFSLNLGIDICNVPNSTPPDVVTVHIILLT